MLVLLALRPFAGVGWCCRSFFASERAAPVPFPSPLASSPLLRVVEQTADATSTHCHTHSTQHSTNRRTKKNAARPARVPPTHCPRPTMELLPSAMLEDDAHDLLPPAGGNNKPQTGGQRDSIPSKNGSLPGKESTAKTKKPPENTRKQGGQRKAIATPDPQVGSIVSSASCPSTPLPRCFVCPSGAPVRPLPAWLQGDCSLAELALPASVRSCLLQWTNAAEHTRRQMQLLLLLLLLPRLLLGVAAQRHPP
jgi:hypothetical protein